MRKIILLLFGLAFFLCSSSPKTSIDEGGFVDIIIGTTPPPTSNPKPKAPVLIPVSARYYEISQEIVLSFTANLGNVSVTVLNVTTGESVYDTVDSADGIVSVPISGTSGQYYLILNSVGSTTVYSGTFEII